MLIGFLNRLFVRGANWPPLLNTNIQLVQKSTDKYHNTKFSDILFEELATRFDTFRWIVFATLHVLRDANWAPLRVRGVQLAPLHTQVTRKWHALTRTKGRFCGLSSHYPRMSMRPQNNKSRINQSKGANWWPWLRGANWAPLRWRWYIIFKYCTYICISIHTTLYLLCIYDI